MMSLDYVLAAGILAIVALIVYFLYNSFFYQQIQNVEYQAKQISIADSTVTVKVADSPQKRELGLMNVSSLPANEGMIFVFDKPDYHSFWMKNMSIPIDIIYIEKNKTIVDIWKNAQPCIDICKSYSPKNKSMYVLEVKANFTDRHDVKIGTMVFFQNLNKNA